MTFATVPAFVTMDFDLAAAGSLPVVHGRQSMDSMVRRAGESRRRTSARVFLATGEDIRARSRVVPEIGCGTVSVVALSGSDRA